MRTDTERGLFGLLLLGSLFIGSLVVCNLIATKFTEVDLGFKTFTVSVGILPYPLTFLVTDILSEIYGKRRASQVVLTGFAASVMVVGIVQLALAFEALPFGASNAAFEEVFGQTWRVITASMCAYLVAQLVDVQLFHFWKRLTKGRHLWLRNNASTVCSQLVDTTLVILVLFVGVDGGPTGEEMVGMILDGWVFKMLCALADTPIAYLVVHLLGGFRQPEGGAG